MALRGIVVVLVLKFLACHLCHTTLAHATDVADRTLEYLVEGTDGRNVELRLLERHKRDDPDLNAMESTSKADKSADALRYFKVNKTYSKSDFAKKKPTSFKKDPSLSKPYTTTTTTITTTTTTTTTSLPPVANEAEVNLEENKTGGKVPMDPQETTAETGEDAKKEKGTEGGEDSSSNRPPVTTEGSTDTTTQDNDPDSGDDVVDPVDGYNTSQATVDHHRYYRSHTIKGMEQVQQYWVDLDSVEEKVVTNEMLSASHRRAATVPLTFEFPFYGHMLRNITIATGGFLFTGDFVHTWLAATQYIAPLMANFDTSMSKNASVKYADNGTSFTVQWKNVLLKDHADAGTFTFQVTLHKSGDIVFTYKQVPMFVTAIVNDQHPVKVGLSDAYIVDRTIFFVRRKTIYEYHKIDMKKNSKIGNWTAIVFKALPTCVSMQTCDDCLSSHNISFQCQWCGIIGRCSNGLDRNRQEWLQNRCEQHHIQRADYCSNLPVAPIHVDTFDRDASVEPLSAGSQSPSATNTSKSGGDGPTTLPSPSASPPSHTPSPPHSSHFPPDPSHTPLHTPSTTSSSGVEASDSKLVGELESLALTSGRGVQQKAEVAGANVGVVVGVVFLVALLLGAVGWIAYAYLFPHSASGQILIRYRPSTWSWKRGEARYTAAAIHSIHM